MSDDSTFPTQPTLPIPSTLSPEQVDSCTPSSNYHRMLSVASFNLFNYIAPPNAFYEFSNIYEQERWQGKNHWMAAQIRAMDADIIGFQEVFSLDALTELTQQLGYSYFASVDTPRCEQDDYVFTAPVVALASRHPIVEVTALEPVWSAEQLGLEITFSRTPLKATIEVPQLGLVDVYVVHLKSQRATDITEIETTKRDMAGTGLVAEPVHSTKERRDNHPNLTVEISDGFRQQIGQWLSTIQRGWEALLLRQSIGAAYQRAPRPSIIMGDFNRDLASSELQCLVTNREEDPFALFDSQRLAHLQVHSEDASKLPNQTRTPTYYHFGQGNVLDYILVSREFCADDAEHIGKVVTHRVLDQHLIDTRFERDRDASDHAQVVVQIRY